MTKAVIAEKVIRLKTENNNNNRKRLVLEGRNRKHRIGGGGRGRPCETSRIETEINLLHHPLREKGEEF